MSHLVRHAFRVELDVAKAARLAGNLELAIHHFERAHILGQRYFFAHLVTHFYLLRIAMQRAQAREIAGQLLRLLAVLPGFLVGWVPVGNPGSARVSALAPMPVPEDLQVHFKAYSVMREVGIRAALLSIAVLGAAGLGL